MGKEIEVGAMLGLLWGADHLAQKKKRNELEGRNSALLLKAENDSATITALRESEERANARCSELASEVRAVTAKWQAAINERDRAANQRDLYRDRSEEFASKQEQRERTLPALLLIFEFGRLV